MNEVSDADRAAILALIEAETAAFWKKDFAAWSACWLHEPFVRRWGWWGAQGGMTLRDGWIDHAARMRQLMQANPCQTPSR